MTNPTQDPVYIAEDLIAEDIDAYLLKHQHKTMLRFITCGSVDDGKSTLIGRLLYDSKMIFEDQLASLEHDSKAHGTQGQNIDFALLVDGLAAEREQGITIDVAYRYFSTNKRSFIVADTPGHEQYTGNMATGASTADAAVILVDARKGVVTQTRRHVYIARLLGIRRFLLAVNKMDLIDFDQARFEAIVDTFSAFAEHLDLGEVTAIPVSALGGDNVCRPSGQMDWYGGPSVLAHLEDISVTMPASAPGFRMPVQLAVRPNADFRGFAGTVASGTVAVGDPVTVEPGGGQSTIAGIASADGALECAMPGQAVTLQLADQIDVSRGDVIRHRDWPMQVTDQLQAHLIWMSEDKLNPGRQYILKTGTRSAVALISELKYKVNINTLEHTAAKILEFNDIAVCNISIDRRIACDPYSTCRETGAFILIDRFSYETVGAGMIDFALRRAGNLTRQVLTVDKAARLKAMGQKPGVLWFTGLSGAGKSTVANRVEGKLHAMGRRTYMLDGDNVRFGLNRDLGFTDADRVENVRRIAEVAKLFADAGMIVLVSVISPFRSEREMARSLLPVGEFFEIFVDASLETCEARDPKGLYARARRGEIENFTGISSPYEVPISPDLKLDTATLEVEEAADRVIALLERDGRAD